MDDEKTAWREGCPPYVRGFGLRSMWVDAERLAGIGGTSVHTHLAPVPGSCVHMGGRPENGPNTSTETR